MALDDILFSEGDIQNIVLNIPQGTLNPPDDIVFDYEAVTIVPSTGGISVSRAVGGI